MPVGEDPGVQVVGIGQVRIARQPAERDLERRLQLAALPQGLAQAQEDQARRVGGVLRR